MCVAGYSCPGAVGLFRSDRSTHDAPYTSGFVTSYLADLTVPALLYVVSRGLATGKRRNVLMRWLGRTPERAASVFFLASTATEVSQIYWPRGFFAGRYDPWDIVAYGAGLSACYCCERLQGTRLSAPDPGT